MNMKRKVLKCAFLCMTPWVLGACEKELVSDDIVVNDSSLSISTRSVTAEETVSFPVAVYVFNAESKKCVKHETLVSKDTPLEFKLTHGTYDIYAIGGVDESIYSLPSEDDLSETTEISLKEGQEHSDLMTAHSLITLAEDGENTLTLEMERQVLLLSSATIKQIPSNITAVSFSLTPSYQSIRINGELGTTWTHPYSLVNDGEGTWSLHTPTMLLLSPNGTTITVSLTKENGTVKSFSYSFPEKLEKNYQICITGNYQEDNTVNLVGNITGTTWAGTKEVTFCFGDNDTDDDNNGNDDTGNTLINETTPNSGSIYKDCYVLKVESKDDANEVLLLYHDNIDIQPGNKTEAQMSQEIHEITSLLTLNNISNWRLPNEEEARLINYNGQIINQRLEDKFKTGMTDLYLYTKGEHLKTFLPINNSFLERDYSLAKYLRPVTILRFKK